ncbi:uncharacterized protein LOC108047230 [Drosophila rhopaloa]|uniref:Uncharacterized protein LOC108047230 n=1 Tax=Drosophila rhopaloa TaxID=1041015 RepID=A0A6P4FBH3_DRORH|nr:uncharacterized protein LOC108047230 [Drosophila rhopaloa]
MAVNLNTQQVEESKQKGMTDSTRDNDPKMTFHTDLVINDIIARSLESQANPLTKEPSSSISFRTTARIIMMLNRTLKRASSSCNRLLESLPEDIDYWRNLAESRGVAIQRYQRVVDTQRRRIETLERDLQTLVRLARETQQMLAEIGAEKRAKQERGHGEHAN